jgi:O-antigen/teichoic acid export membrane protein
MTGERAHSRIIVGGSWAIAVQVVERIIGLASIAILARLLTPDDFGVVAVAGTVVAAVELLSAFGFDWALVRQRDLTPDYLNSAWTLRVLFGLGTFVALALLGPVAADFYRLPPLRPVLVALGLASFLGSLENIGTVYFRRDFAFHKEFLLRVTTKVAGFVVAIPVAFVYRSYWALVVGMVVVRASSTVASYALHRFRPWPTLKHTRELFGFSLWLLIGNIVDYCSTRFSSLYLGRVFGSHAAGLFSVAGDISQMPISGIAAPINRVAYSKYSEDIRANRSLTSAYLEISPLIWMVSLPLCGGTIAVASEIVRLLLGPKWQDAEAVVRLLTLGTALSLVTANTHYVYWALGRSKVVAMLSVVTAAIIVPATIVCSHFAGYEGVAWAYVVTSAALAPINFAMLRRDAGIRFSDLWTRVWRVTLAAGAMVLLLLGTFPQSSHETTAGTAALLLLKVVAGIAIYVGGVAALWLSCKRPEGPEQRVLQLILQWVKRPANPKALS